MKEEIRLNKDTIEKLKSTDTAIVLYESRFQELNEKDKKNVSALKAERDKLEEKDLIIKQQKQQIQNTLQANEENKAEISKVNAMNKDLMRRLEEAEKMLAQTSGHRVMEQQTDQ